MAQVFDLMRSVGKRCKHAELLTYFNSGVVYVFLEGYCRLPCKLMLAALQATAGYLARQYRLPCKHAEPPSSSTAGWWTSILFLVGVPYTTCGTKYILISALVRQQWGHVCVIVLWPAIPAFEPVHGMQCMGKVLLI